MHDLVMARQENVFSRDMVLHEADGWLAAAIFQGARFTAQLDDQVDPSRPPLPWTAEQWSEFNATHSFHNEHLREVYEAYFFVCAVRQAMRWLTHVREYEPKLAADIDAFESATPHLKDLRDMREHEDEYLSGEGKKDKRDDFLFLFAGMHLTASSVAVTGDDDYLLGGRVSLPKTIAALRKIKPIIAAARETDTVRQ